MNHSTLIINDREHLNKYYVNLLVEVYKSFFNYFNELPFNENTNYKIDDTLNLSNIFRTNINYPVFKSDVIFNNIVYNIDTSIIDEYVYHVNICKYVTNYINTNIIINLFKIFILCVFYSITLFFLIDNNFAPNNTIYFIIVDLIGCV